MIYDLALSLNDFRLLNPDIIAGEKQFSVKLYNIFNCSCSLLSFW